MMVNEFNKAFGLVMRSWRKLQGITLATASKRAGLSLYYTSQVERGQKNPSSNTMRMLCAAINLPLSDALRASADLMDGTSGLVESDVRSLYRNGDELLKELIP